MRVLSFFSVFLIAQTAFAVDVSDLGMKLDPAKNKAPNLDVKNHEIVGTCDGVKYTNAAEFEGCQKNVSLRMLDSNPAYPQMPLAPKALPDQKR